MGVGAEDKGCKSGDGEGGGKEAGGGGGRDEGGKERCGQYGCKRSRLWLSDKRKRGVLSHLNGSNGHWRG